MHYSLFVFNLLKLFSPVIDTLGLKRLSRKLRKFYAFCGFFVQKLS